MGSYSTGLSPTGSLVVVNFPAPGAYPYELDYTECCDGSLVTSMTVSPSKNPVNLVGSPAKDPGPIKLPPPKEEP